MKEYNKIKKSRIAIDLVFTNLQGVTDKVENAAKITNHGTVKINVNTEKVLLYQS